MSLPALAAYPPLLQVGVFPPNALALISRHFELIPQDTCNDADRASVGGIITRSNYTIAPELIDSLPALRVIATCGVGYDGIPVAHARQRGVQVTNTPDVLNPAVAELTLGLLLSLLRRIPVADAFVRSNQWRQGTPFPLGSSLAGKRVGIVGLGRIGRAIAARLLPFDTRIAYYGPTDHGLDWPHHASPVSLARDSDILIVCCPGGAATAGLINAEVLAALGSAGLLINVSRGTVVDEAALVHALQHGDIAGAALDVFQVEPTANLELCALDNVILTPHIGSATEETRLAMAQLAIDNLHEVLAGRPALTPVG